jgi:G3E family GTPase
LEDLAGSGKTTMILKLSKRFSDAGQRIGVIVQETGDVDYDEGTLHEIELKRKTTKVCSIHVPLMRTSSTTYRLCKKSSGRDLVFIEAEETELPVSIRPICSE